MNHYRGTCAVIAVLLCAWVLLAAQSAQAVVVYSEPVQGDLPADPNAAPIIPLLQGPNEIEGDVGGQDQDAFRFVFPTDKEVKEVEFVWLGAVNDLELTWEWPSNTGLRSTVWMIPAGSPGYFLFENLPISPDPAPTPSDFTPGGVHGIRMKSADDPPFTITITITPEPGTLSLLAIGGVALLRRRN